MTAKTAAPVLLTEQHKPNATGDALKKRLASCALGMLVARANPPVPGDVG